MLALVLSACSPPEPLTAQEALLRFEQDPQALQAEIAAIEDPVERQVLVMALAESFPGQALATCALLDGPTARRCEAAHNRPHLHAEKQPPEPLAVVTAEYPSSPFDYLPADGERVGSLSRAVAAGSVHEAAAACNSQPPGQARDECYFRAAEARRQPVLCLGAEAFAANCLGHVARRTAELAPPSDGDDWSALVDAVQGDGLLLPLAPPYRDRVWALAMRSSTARAGSLGGHALDHVPYARRHLVCGLALRLVEEQPEAGLAELKALLEARPEPSPPRDDPGFALKPELRDLEIDEGQRSTFLWDNAMRPWLEGDADLELCLELARVQLAD